MIHHSGEHTRARWWIERAYPPQNWGYCATTATWVLWLYQCLGGAHHDFFPVLKTWRLWMKGSTQPKASCISSFLNIMNTFLNMTNYYIATPTNGQNVANPLLISDWLLPWFQSHTVKLVIDQPLVQGSSYIHIDILSFWKYLVYPWSAIPVDHVGHAGPITEQVWEHQIY